MADILAELTAAERAEFEEAKERGRDPEKEALFVERYMKNSANFDYGSYNEMLVASYREAGFVAKYNEVRQAKTVLRRCLPAIEEQLRWRLSGGVSIGVAQLIQLAQFSKNDAVRLKAATELLNKGGFAEAHKIQVVNEKDLSDAELQQQINAAMEAQGLRVVRIEHGKETPSHGARPNLPHQVDYSPAGSNASAIEEVPCQGGENTAS